MTELVLQFRGQVGVNPVEFEQITRYVQPRTQLIRYLLNDGFRLIKLRRFELLHLRHIRQLVMLEHTGTWLLRQLRSDLTALICE